MAKEFMLPKTIMLLLGIFWFLQDAASADAFDHILGHGEPIKDVQLVPKADLLVSVSFDYSVVLKNLEDFQRNKDCLVMMIRSSRQITRRMFSRHQW